MLGLRFAKALRPRSTLSLAFYPFGVQPNWKSDGGPDSLLVDT